MNRSLLFFLLVFVSCSSFAQNSKGNSSYFFYENKGQIIDQTGKQNTSVQYLFNSPGLNVQLKKEGFSYDVFAVKKTIKKATKGKVEDLLPESKKRLKYDLKIKVHRVDIEFVKANKNSQIFAEGKSEDYENYYNIPGKQNGIEKVHRFQKIIYRNIYPYIDLVFFKPEDSLKPVEYNFVLNPGGKISDIKLKFNGAKSRLTDGKISLDLRFGEMQENIPHSWEENGNAKNAIDVEFKDLGKGIYGFLAEKNTSDKIVVIDPVPTRVWGSYFGDYYYDNTSTFIETDQFDQVYFGGLTTNPNHIATAGAHQTTIQNGTYNNGFIEKFDQDGKRIWGTYIGNFIYETSLYDGIVGSDAIYVGGSTFDQTGGINNITTPRTHKEFATPNSREAFIMKLDLDGKRIWGTYYGGTGFEDIFDLTFDKNGDVLASGFTDSPDQISTPNSYLPVKNSNISGFFSKFSSTGQLLYGSYFYRPVNHIAADSNNNYFIAGQYFNLNLYPNIGTAGTHQPNMSGYANAYILKFDSGFNKLWGTYYGGSHQSTALATNYIAGMQVDLNNHLIISGTTTSTDFIATPGAFKEVHGSNVENGFIAKFLPDGKIDWGTYYGGEGFFGNFISTLFVNATGDIYVAGDTRSDTGIATSNGYQPQRTNSDDGYFSKFSNGGSQIWGTYYADMGQDELQNITFRNKHVYVIGYTAGYNFTHPFGTPGTFMPVAYTGYHLAKFRDCQNNVTASGSTTICVGKTIKLFATGGTSYSWTGPNGFTSNLQNPMIPNATAAASGTYICTITGTGDCDGNYAVTVRVEDKTAPVPDLNTLPTITGNCKAIIAVIPTATDTCAGNIIGTTTDPLQYSLPGNYIIHWSYTDQNGNTTIQNQNVVITSEPLADVNATQTFCLLAAPKISDIIITGTDIKWYDVMGNLLPTNTLLVNGTKYFATQTLNGCESLKTEVLVTVNDPNPPTGNATQNFCSAQNPTISNIILIEQNVKWYNGIGTLLPITTPLVDGKTYYATQTLNGCESTQKIAVTVSITNGGIQAKDFSTPFCNDTTANTKADNLNNYKGNLITNPTNYILEFFDANNQVIPNPTNVNLNIGTNLFNVKVSNSLGCFVFVKLTLTMNPKPILNLPTDVEFCKGQNTKLNAGSGFASYEWSKDNFTTVISTDQILVVSEAGKYSVKVKNSFGCENVSSVNVTQSFIATIVGIQIVNNTATVQMSDAGDFEYSLDNFKWQDSNVFKNLNNGSYTVFVKTKLGCIIGSMNFSIFNISNVFTPNADGSNDTWKISGLENYPGSEIQVFDRFGDIVFQKITNGAFEWNGFSNSRVLPTGNYWYVVKVSDGRLLNGWVLIKNRN